MGRSTSTSTSVRGPARSPRKGARDPTRIAGGGLRVSTRRSDRGHLQLPLGGLVQGTPDRHQPVRPTLTVGGSWISSPATLSLAAGPRSSAIRRCHSSTAWCERWSRAQSSTVITWHRENSPAIHDLLCRPSGRSRGWVALPDTCTAWKAEWGATYPCPCTGSEHEEVLPHLTAAPSNVRRMRATAVRRVRAKRLHAWEHGASPHRRNQRPSPPRAE
jgi:hypothetical protein